MKSSLLFFILFSTYSYAEGEISSKKGSAPRTEKSKLEIENELVNFNSIRKELQNDGLSDNAKIITKAVEVVKKVRMKNIGSRHSYPKQQVFWTFFSEYWLVKKSQLLKWDFQKPDYGLMATFESFLEKFGFYNKKIKILYTNSPTITHLALPSNPGEYIFLISVPFIRTLDLTKLEISLILFEDFLRVEADYFKKNIKNNKVTKLLGQKFKKSNFKQESFDNVFNQYEDIIFKRGFNFQQQFNITKLLNSYLISDMKLWNSYYKLLEKLDSLVKNNILYKNYNKIYPSPELQLNWFKPKNKRKY